MEPNSNSQPGFELPAAHQGENLAFPAELPPIKAESSPAKTVPAIPVPTQPVAAIPGVQPQAVVPASTPQIADDVDLIEKEWVEKAKAIVSQTRNDPHAQNKEINRFKADYLKKRYNKEIKLEDR